MRTILTGMVRTAAAFALLAAFVAAPGAPARADFAAAVEAYDQGDYAASFAESLPLARAGDREAQFMLGYLYARGEGVRRDPVAAYFWYALAARQGDEFSARALESLARRMSAAQIAAARARLRAWKPAEGARGGE